MSSWQRPLGVLLVLGVVTACAERTTAPADEEFGPAFAATAGPVPDAGYIQAKLDEINATLASTGAGYAVARAELSLAPSANPASPIVVFASDHELRLPSQWVAGDPRRGATGPGLTWGNYAPLMTASGVGDVEASIDAAFGTWNAVGCSNLDLTKVMLSPGNLPSLLPLEQLLPLTVSVHDPFEADISTIGFLPPFIFELVLGQGAGSSVLGVTFTYVFTSGNVPTDVDGDHRLDTALKEIWYNDNGGFGWSTSGTSGTDVETVALHEEGHGLELGHFGRLAGNLKTGKLIVSPRAVMNAYILGTQRTLLGTDNGAYCGNWAAWPN